MVDTQPPPAAGIHGPPTMNELSAPPSTTTMAVDRRQQQQQQQQSWPEHYHAAAELATQSPPTTTGRLGRVRSILAGRQEESTANLEHDGSRGSGRKLRKRGRLAQEDKEAGEGQGRVGHDDGRGGREGNKIEGRGGGRAMVAGNGPLDLWIVYCWLLTCLVPPVVLRNVFGKRSIDAQRAWREKMGLVSIVLLIMAFVGYLTFGFTQTVCGTPPNRYRSGSIPTSSLIVNGFTYDLGNWNHPAAGSTFNGSSNPLFESPWTAGGMDASFLLQTTNQACLGVITPPLNGSAITGDGGEQLDWYFPCNLRPQNGSAIADLTNVTSDFSCHVSLDARAALAGLRRQGQVYFTWDDLKNEGRNLAAYQGRVLDLSLLTWLEPTVVAYPSLYDAMARPTGANATLWRGRDLTAWAMRTGSERELACLADVVVVGFVSGDSIGCKLSEVVLYVSLIFICGIIGIKFAMALTFGWFLSWRLVSFPNESQADRMRRSEAIETWSSDIYRVAPSRYRPNVYTPGKKAASWIPTTSRFSRVELGRPGTIYVPPGGGQPSVGSGRSRDLSYYGSRLPYDGATEPPTTPILGSPWATTTPGLVTQPPPSFEPFGYPLAHTILLVTAYSESIDGLRTTLDSLATTDYPASHKTILVVADGLVKGSGSTRTTPDIVLGMMKDLVVPVEEVAAHSYVAIADGHKKHNMARVYAGLYDYDGETVEASKQQRVPIILVAKVGNPREATDPKPGNRGKRDSQVVLMAFLQKALFDERMTVFEFELFNSWWQATGITPDRYEVVLMVDADTKVFPDSVTRMNAAMWKDQSIMGLCGETKIANKTETWVTMIQVFEYYISHHSTKAFESVFGGVTCLPGCFSMYRIKSRKGSSEYWVPILASPDIIDAYSVNIVDTLHKKNLLLLGEDRYLSTLMLKTFPRRKMMFLPQAVCKTVVPDTFRVLLSQRRRWINSTIHNLFELLFVRDLCGIFCFSMQFVVGVDLIGCLALPAAISFTLYIVIIAILPSEPTPTTSLILLALIFGLPAVLIAVTAVRRIVYIGWMLIYLVSLPIWNLVLPLWAFWHFDDFSWGSTRVVEGEVPSGSHGGDRVGRFDPSQIVMKRWAEFERERRWKSDSSSQDLADADPALTEPPLPPPPPQMSRTSTDTSFGSIAA